MNKDVEVLQSTVKLLTQAVTELYTWAQQAESSGSIPAGSMSRARDLLELERVRGDIALIQETLVSLDTSTKSQLRAKLNARVSTLQKQLDDLQRGIHGA